MAPPDPPPDPFAPIRARAAQRLRSLVDKQQQLAASWLAMATNHTNLSATMIADALQTGTLKPEQFFSNTTAMAIECVGWGLDVWLAGLPGGVGGALQRIDFIADEDAETVVPVALAGATPAQIADVTCAPLVRLGAPPGAPTLAVSKSELNGSIMVEVDNLIVGGQPYPVGLYVGEVTLNVAGTSPRLALITLARI